MYFLRLVVAGIAATVLAVFLGIALYSDALSFLPDVVKYIVFFGFILGCGVGFLFLARNSPSRRKQAMDAAWIASQEIIEEYYRAKQAVRIEQFEDEGFHFLIELDDDRVLFLTGQYLYHFCGDKDNKPTFPCTDFTLKRIKDHGFVTSLHPHGDYLKPAKIFRSDHASIIYEKWEVPDGGILPMNLAEALRQLEEWKS